MKKEKQSLNPKISKSINFRGKKVFMINKDLAQFIDADKFLYLRHSEDDWSEPIHIEKYCLVNRFGFLLSKDDLFKGDKGPYPYISISKKEREMFMLAEQEII